MKIFNIISDFFYDIGNFFKSRSVLGVDIGTTSIKIAELTRKEERFALVNYGILEDKEYLIVPNRAIQSSSLKISEKDTAESLKILLKEMKTKSRVAVGSIPAFAAFTTVLDMPVLSVDETEKAVLFQAPQYIPIPIADTVIDWFKISEYDGERGQRYQRIFLIGIPKETIERYKNIFRNAGLKLISLELDGLAINRVITNEDANARLIVDLGSETSNIFITKDEKTFYSGQTDYGGVYLTQAIARSLGISVMRAEELKKRRGLMSDGAESELSTLTQPFLDVIIQEVNHAKSTFERRYGGGINQMMLMGGGANLLGVEKYFTQEMGISTIKPNFFSKIGYDLKLEPFLNRLENELPIAVGLAERYFIQ